MPQESRRIIDNHNRSERKLCMNTIVILNVQNVIP